MCSQISWRGAQNSFKVIQQLGRDASERQPSFHLQQRRSFEPDITGNTYLKYGRVQCTFVEEHYSTYRTLLFFVSGWALIWGFFVASPLSATATKEAVATEQASLLHSYRYQSDETEGTEASSELRKDHTLPELLDKARSGEDEIHFPVAARELRTLQQQLVTAANWGVTDEETESLNLHHGYSISSQPLSGGDSLRVRQNAGDAFASFDPQLPLFSTLEGALPEYEGTFDAATDVAIRSGGVLNAQSQHQMIRRRNPAYPASCPEGIVSTLGRPTASGTAAGYKTINSEEAAETVDDGGLQSSPFRRMQQFDPLQFGPVAQYAQYLATFTPPAQQQQQLQMLQQAIAAGVGGNPAALKRLQRRAQAAAYANSVSSHPLIQGVVRTAYTAVAEILNSVSLADVVQGALGGGAFLLPVPPIA